jgi:hypothetical protein
MRVMRRSHWQLLKWWMRRRLRVSPRPLTRRGNRSLNGGGLDVAQEAHPWRATERGLRVGGALGVQRTPAESLEAPGRQFD